MADTIEIIQGTATVVEVAGPTGPQGPAGAAGASQADVLTVQGDLLYRGASAAARLGIGSSGQVLKVSGGIPAWANESGAVSSVAGKTGVVTLDKNDVGLSNVANTAQVTSVTGTAPIVSSGGTTPAISISAATTSAAGSMSSADKTKLDGIASGATANTASTATPSALGTAAAGTATNYAREDHIHSADLSDSAFRVVGSSDATKKVAFEVDTLVDTATTRTLTVPNASGRIQVEGQPIGNTTPAAGTFTTLSANNGTLTASAPVLDLAQHWNNAAVTFTGLRFNATDTASASNSILADFQRNGSSFIRLARSFSAPYIYGTTSDSGVGFSSTGIIARGNGSDIAICNTGNWGWTIRSDGRFEWAANTNPTTAADLQIFRDAADTLAQRRGANGQTLRIYNTYTDASNHERLSLRWASNVAIIGTEKAGTGSARALEFQTDGTTRLTIGTTGQVGIGVAPERPLHIQGSAAFGRMDRQGTNGPAWLMIRMATGTTVSSSWLFGPATGVASVTNDDFSIIDYGTSISGTSGTQRLTIAKSDGQLTVNGNLNLSTKDLVTDTTTGTKIGTGTTQKIGFFNATPVVQQAAVADATDAASTQARLNDLLARVRTLGLIAT